jgi:hypothetical protein
MSPRTLAEVAVLAAAASVALDAAPPLLAPQ